MFDLSDVRAEYDRLDKILGINTKNIELKKNKGYRMGGYCKTKKYFGKQKPILIAINEVAFDLPKNEFYDLIRHEYAHAADVLLNGYMSVHGHNWKQVCIQIGCSPERLINTESILHEKLQEVKKNSVKYTIICPCCGKEYSYTRMTKIYKSFLNYNKLHCPKCDNWFIREKNSKLAKPVEEEVVKVAHTFQDKCGQLKWT